MKIIGSISSFIFSKNICVSIINNDTQLIKVLIIISRNTTIKKINIKILPKT